MFPGAISEENLKAAVLLPFLSSIDISLDQIEVEKTLRLRLGRGIHEYTSNTIAGRLDLLVRSREGKNLFVVELKREDSNLTDEDRDQGISYARLLDQMAPFVLLTNGRESHLYDTISREELASGFGAAYSRFGGRVTTEDIRIRYEALKHFLGYSPENVRLFSICQQKERMKGVRGHGNQLDRKYIPDIYIPRKQVREAIDQFVAGPGSVFAMVGESGVGKTNEMCSLAERLSASHVVLFFSAGTIPTSLSDVLVDDFNWHFSEHLREPELFKRLSDIATITGRSVLIVVDALDEAPLQTFAQSVSNCVLHLSSFSGNVRLIVSVKTAEWDRFARFHGTPSALATSIEASASHGDSLPQNSQPFVLTEFAENELIEVESKYQQVFQLSGLPAGHIRTLCRLPFFLRLFGEVYSGRSEELPTSISESELVKKWLARKCSSTTSPDLSRLQLIAIAKAAYDRACDPTRESGSTAVSMERVPEQDVIRELGNPRQSISNDLVSHGLALRHEDEHGRVSFSLYYGRVRDYLIATQVLQLDRMTVQQFGEKIEMLMSNYMLQGVLSWHLREAPTSHIDELKRALRGRALLYLETYNRIIEEVVPGVKSGVIPFTEGLIGMAYDPTPGGMHSFALYPVTPRVPERIVEIVPVADGSNWPFASAVEKFHGYARSGGSNYSNSDPSKAASRFAYEQIKEAIKEGRLDDAISVELLIEACVAIASSFRERIRQGAGAKDLRLNSEIFSVELNMLDKAVQSYFGAEFYKREWTDRQIRDRSRFVTRHGKFVSVQMDGTAMEEASRRSRIEAEDGARFPKPNVINEQEFYRLPDILFQLRERGIQVIRPVFPPPDLGISHADAAFPDHYSDQRLAEVIKTFFALSIRTYKELVERNFPGLRHLMTTYSRLPLSVMVDYKRPKIATWRDWGSIRYAFVQTDSISIDIEVHIDAHDPVFVLSPDAGMDFIDYRGRLPVFGLSCTDLSSLLRPSGAPGFGSKLGNSGQAGLLAPIRAFAYNLLREEFHQITPELLSARIMWDRR